MLEQCDRGKPVKQARTDAADLARYFEFYAGAREKLHCETIPYGNGYSVMPWCEPHGVTGHTSLWNYPVQMFGRSVGGALAASIDCVVAAGIRTRDGVQRFAWPERSKTGRFLPAITVLVVASSCRLGGVKSSGQGRENALVAAQRLPSLQPVAIQHC